MGTSVSRSHERLPGCQGRAPVLCGLQAARRVNQTGMAENKGREAMLTSGHGDLCVSLRSAPHGKVYCITFTHSLGGRRFVKCALAAGIHIIAGEVEPYTGPSYTWNRCLLSVQATSIMSSVIGPPL